MRIICLGEALIDLVPLLGQSLSSAELLAVQPGGAPLNVAISLKRLGADPIFLGQLSRDVFGCRLRQILLDQGVEFSPVEPVERQSRLAIVDNSECGANFQFYGHEPADTLLTADQAIARIGRECAGLYVSSLMTVHPAAARTQRAAVVRAIEQGIPIYSDPNPRRSLWHDEQLMAIEVRRLLSASRVAKLSLDDAQLLGWSSDPETLIEQALTRWNTQVVVTDGSNGVWAYIDGTVVHVPAARVEVVDPTGAGDAFFATTIFESIRDGGLTIDHLRRASVAGALTTTKVGSVAGIPTTLEIDRFLCARC